MVFMAGRKFPAKILSGSIPYAAFYVFGGVGSVKAGRAVYIQAAWRPVFVTAVCLFGLLYSTEEWSFIFQLNLISSVAWCLDLQVLYYYLDLRISPHQAIHKTGNQLAASLDYIGRWYCMGLWLLYIPSTMLRAIHSDEWRQCILIAGIFSFAVVVGCEWKNFQFTHVSTNHGSRIVSRYDGSIVT